MRGLAYAFLALSFVVFILGLVIRFAHAKIGINPLTILSLCQLGIWASIACSILSINPSQNK